MECRGRSWVLGRPIAFYDEQNAWIRRGYMYMERGGLEVETRIIRYIARRDDLPTGVWWLQTKRDLLETTKKKI